jgi:hypothetical protein
MPANDEPPHFPPLMFPPLEAAGVPLTLDALARHEKLKGMGLATGWALFTKGEIVVIDQNMRNLTASYNKLAETAYALNAALQRADRALDLHDDKTARRIIAPALALPLPARVDVDKLPPRPSAN